ncbi:MAG: epimerase [Sphingobacteriales bacterium 50-39]|nr:NAD(P)-dependent oxidoreductase [Sphingobacteriales bacterium]OJW53743.1 MAG: epimerase [Sphingobacteriales bacterium 50-39]
MKKILVTGATGFIGNHVVRRLLADGHHVIATSANPERAYSYDWFKKVEYIPLDFSRLDSSVNYYQWFGQPDVLLHLAWEGLPDYRSPLHEDVYFPRHASFLESLIKGGLQNINVTGTCLEYGLQEGCLREDVKPMPIVSYARAKDRLRVFLEGMQAEHAFMLKWIRLFYTFGEGQNPKSLLSQLEKALSDGEQVFNMSGGQQIRDYLSVERLAGYLCKISFQEKTTGIINCCSGQPIAVKQLVADYLKTHNKTITLNTGYYPYPDYEPMSFWGDTAKLKDIIEHAQV